MEPEVTEPVEHVSDSETDLREPTPEMDLDSSLLQQILANPPELPQPIVYPKAGDFIQVVFEDPEDVWLKGEVQRIRGVGPGLKFFTKFLDGAQWVNARPYEAWKLCDSDAEDCIPLTQQEAVSLM